MGDVKRISTEAGMIPEDWDTCTLGDAFTKIEAGVSVNSNERIASEFFVLKTSAVRNGIVDVREAKPVIATDYHRLKCPLQKRSIVISRMNTPDLVGAVGYNDEDHKNVFLPDRLWQITEDKESRYDFQWLSYLLNLQRFRNAVRSTATGTSNSMKNISKDRLREIVIPVPDIEEQRTISAAIADIDSLIASLYELVQKKQMIRNGAVQKLISEEAVIGGVENTQLEYRIGSIGDFFSGLIGKSKKDFGHGSSDYITFLNVLSNTIVDIHILENVDVAESERQNQVQYGDLLFNTSSETPEEVGMCAVFLDKDKKPYLNSFCFGFRLKNASRIDPLFVAYYFNSGEGRNIMKILAQGATRYNLSKSSFEETHVFFPKYDRQVEIAQVLLDMDNEIATLKDKLKKYEKIKAGMMDELLTGKIRLV